MKKFLAIITRCKDEFFIKEFVKYYLYEGVDHIYIIDDDSYDKDIYNDVLFYRNVSVLFEKNTRDEAYEANKLYREVKHKYEWMMFIDVDEFVAPKRNPFNTLREELAEHFSQYDCIKIPWVMMSSAGRDKNPDSVLRDNVWRWNHDCRHPHEVRKFRCRYDQIEVKCIFRPNKFKTMDLHFPTDAVCDVSVVDSVKKSQGTLTHFYDNFREDDIKNAHLVCYHHRLISQENSQNKIKCSAWYHDFLMDELSNGDHAEIFDNTLSARQFRKKVFMIGFDRKAARLLHNFFKLNGLASVCYDEKNLAKTMLLNRERGRKLLSSGVISDGISNSNVLYEKLQIISDMTWDDRNIGAKDFYRDLDRQYPNSKFILNICSIESWIESKKQDSNGKSMDVAKAYYGVEEAEVEAIWKTMYVRVLNEISTYFIGRDNFMVFDLDVTTLDNLQEFFKDDMLFKPDLDLDNAIGSYE